MKDFVKTSNYVNANLNLTLKPPVFGNTASGLPFLGFLVKEKGVYLIMFHCA